MKVILGGAQGPAGSSFIIGAVGLLADLGDYDNEAAGFAYATTDTSEVYIRLGDTPGVWSDGIPFVGGTGVHISTTAPIDPDAQPMWYDPEDGILAIWDGTVWVGQEFLPIIAPPDPGEAFMFLGETLYFLGEPLTSSTI